MSSEKDERESEKDPEDELNLTVMELQSKMNELEKRFLGISISGESSTPFAPRSTVETKISKLTGTLTAEPETEHQKVTTKLPSVKLPEFSGQDFEEFLDDFQRWLRMTNVQKEPQETKLDWLLEACTAKTKPIVKKLIRDSIELGEVLTAMSKLFPKLDNDLTLRAKLEKVPSLAHNCEPAQVAQLFLELEELMVKMSKGAMSDQEKFIMLTKKIHPKTYQEMRADRFFKRRTETYGDLKSALFEKVEEDWQEKHLVQLKKEQLHALQDDDVPQQPNFTSFGKGKGKDKGQFGHRNSGKGLNK